jgi:hypothetical protein
MNFAPVIIGAVLGALSAGPAPGAGVLLCDPWHCRSSPYFPPPIVPVRPPVVFLPAPYPPLGPDYPANPPQRPQERPQDPPHVAQAPPPARSPPPPSRHETAQQKDIEDSIEAFCDGHPDEQFCGKLGAWLRAHPNNRR